MKKFIKIILILIFLFSNYDYSLSFDLSPIKVEPHINFGRDPFSKDEINTKGNNSGKNQNVSGHHNNIDNSTNINSGNQIEGSYIQGENIKIIINDNKYNNNIDVPNFSQSNTDNNLINSNNLQQNNLVKGFRIYQYEILLNSSVADNPIPDIELGSHIAKKSIFSTKELSELIGISVSSPRLYRAYGYLKVDIPSKYIVSVSSNYNRFYGCIYIDNKLITKGKRDPFSISCSTNVLNVGTHTIDIRIYERVNNNLIAYKAVYPSNYHEIKFLIRSTKNNNFLPLHTVLYTENTF